MDNLVESFNRQSINAQRLRAKHEKEAVTLIKQLGLTGSKIQVSGGVTLQLTQRSEPSPLSWALLEKELPAAGLSPQKVNAIISRLQAATVISSTTAEHLCKTST